MSQPAKDNKTLGFNLTIDEVRIIAKLRELADHQRKGVLQALDAMRPKQAATQHPSRRR